MITVLLGSGLVFCPLVALLKSISVIFKFFLSGKWLDIGDISGGFCSASHTSSVVCMFSQLCMLVPVARAMRCAMSALQGTFSFTKADR